MQRGRRRVVGRKILTIKPFADWRALKRPLPLFLIVVCIMLVGLVVLPEIFGTGKMRDYPLWHRVGQRIWDGAALYEDFDFIYPPFAALFLALPSQLGKVPHYLILALGNCLALWLAVYMSRELAAGERKPGGWIAVLPPLMVLPQIFENFDLGQPNILLLTAMLAGLLLLRAERPVLAGGMFAFAAAVKAFPIAVLPYLLWRRHWKASASLVAFLAVFLVLAPAPFRGFERNIAELTQWVDAMKGTEDGFGQRDAQNWSWKNQSVVALTHRLTRPLDYLRVDRGERQAYMNLFDLAYDEANLVLLGVLGLLGVGFVGVMLPASRMTRKSFAEETAILICLMTVTSPLARSYYFVWLLYPVSVLLQRAMDDPRPVVRRRTWIGLVFGAVLAGITASRTLQAYGNETMASFLFIGMLAWHMRNPPAQSPTS
jgi:hypothetical protein